MKALLSSLAIAAFLISTSGVANAAREATARISSVSVKTDSNSSGKKVKKMLIMTEQTQVAMWGTLNVCVLVKDKEGNLFFGRSSFRQPRRSGNEKKSVDKWEFHVEVSELSNPEIEGYYITYKNNENMKVLDTKASNVDDPTTWLKDNSSKTPIGIKAECHTVMN